MRRSVRNFQVLVVSTTPLTSFWSSLLIRFCDCVSSAGPVGDAERFLLAVDVAVTSTALALALVF